MKVPPKNALALSEIVPKTGSGRPKKPTCGTLFPFMVDGVRRKAVQHSLVSGGLTNVDNARNF